MWSSGHCSDGSVYGWGIHSIGRSTTKNSPVEDGGGAKSGSLESPHARVSIYCPAGARTDTQQAIVDCISRGMIQHQQCDCQHAHDCSQKMLVQDFKVMETKSGGQRTKLKDMKC